MGLQAVFFDMGGTIQNFWATRELRLKSIPLFRDCFIRGGIDLDLNDEELTDLISTGIGNYHKWNRSSLVELKPIEVWTKFVLKDYQFPTEKLEKIVYELSSLYEKSFYFREMRPEIPQVLEYLKNKGLKIGIISNTQTTNQVPDNLNEYGIIDYFNPIILSSEYGLRKPDASIFYHAARLANVPTGSCVYVGDKINRDVLGARRSGFRLAIQIHHQFDDGDLDEGATPDAILENMLELIPIIEKELEKDRMFEAAHKDRKVKAFFFDAGDILYYRPQKQVNFNEFLNGKHLNPDPDLAEKAKKVRELAFQGKLDRHEYYRQTVLLYGLTAPNEIEAGVAALDLDDDTVAIYEGVPETIRALKEQGYILGIITDTALPYTVKLKWFEQYGFGHLWDIIVSSKDLGIRKPAPILYEEAILQTGLKPEEAVFVGHKAYEIEGARKAGFKTVAFNYEKSAIADVYIEKFDELLSIDLLEKQVQKD
jgi:putative hydrolase of the HAD superfamily